MRTPAQIFLVRLTEIGNTEEKVDSERVRSEQTGTRGVLSERDASERSARWLSGARIGSERERLAEPFRVRHFKSLIKSTNYRKRSKVLSNRPMRLFKIYNYAIIIK